MTSWNKVFIIEIPILFKELTGNYFFVSLVVCLRTFSTFYFNSPLDITTEKESCSNRISAKNAPSVLHSLSSIENDNLIQPFHGWSTHEEISAVHRADVNNKVQFFGFPQALINTHSAESPEKAYLTFCARMMFLLFKRSRRL